MNVARQTSCLFREIRRSTITKPPVVKTEDDPTRRLDDILTKHPFFAAQVLLQHAELYDREKRWELAREMHRDGRAPGAGADDGECGGVVGHQCFLRKSGIVSPATIESKVSRRLMSAADAPDTSTSAGSGRVL